MLETYFSGLILGMTCVGDSDCIPTALCDQDNVCRMCQCQLIVVLIAVSFLLAELFFLYLSRQWLFVMYVVGINVVISDIAYMYLLYFYFSVSLSV